MPEEAVALVVVKKRWDGLEALQEVSQLLLILLLLLLLLALMVAVHVGKKRPSLVQDGGSVHQRRCRRKGNSFGLGLLRQCKKRDTDSRKQSSPLYRIQ